MMHPERVVLIAVMAGIVSAGFTWFGWGLFQNVFADRRRRAITNPSSTAEQAPESGVPEKTPQQTAARREAGERPAEKPPAERKASEKLDRKTAAPREVSQKGAK